jgi:hypothetical protein
MSDDSGFHCPGQVVTVFSAYATKVALSPRLVTGSTCAPASLQQIDGCEAELTARPSSSFVGIASFR